MLCSPIASGDLRQQTPLNLNRHHAPGDDQLVSPADLLPNISPPLSNISASSSFFFFVFGSSRSDLASPARVIVRRLSHCDF